MNISQFLLILRARYKIILSILAISVLTTLVLSLLWPKSYKATTSLVLSSKGMDPVTGMSLPAQLMPGYMSTQVDIITSHSVAVKVVDMLKFAESPQVRQQFQAATEGKGNIRDWFADRLLPNLVVEPSRESSVIEISFRGADPDFVATLANAFATAYQQTSLQLKIEPAQSATNYLSAQTKVLRDNLEQAQSKLSKYQQEQGITSGIEQNDVESARLNELSAQLVSAQAQAIEASSRQVGARGNAGESPDVSSNPLVQNIKGDIAHAESKLADLAQRFDKNHPQYQSAQAELDKLRSQLQEAIRNTTASVGGTAVIFRQREAEIRAQVAAQKTKVLDLNRTRDQLTVLQRDVESAQHAMDAVNQRFTQTNLESQVNQTDIAVLNPAIAPLRPSSPKISQNLLISVFLGTLLGLGLGLIAEMVDRRVRSVQDIEDGIAIPVLGVIAGDKKPRLRYLPLLRFGRALGLNS